MLSKDEAQKIAASANSLRPDWSVAQVMGVLGKDDIRLRRTYRDTAIAVAALACDPATRQPTRLLESGPWWEATASKPAGLKYHEITDEDCAICFRPPELCSRLSWTDAHDYEPQHTRAVSVPPTPEQKAAIEAARIVDPDPEPEPESDAEYEAAQHHKQWAGETDALDNDTTTEGATP